MKEEARIILRSVLTRDAPTHGNLFEAIRPGFAESGGVELEPLPREAMGDPPTLE